VIASGGLVFDLLEGIPRCSNRSRRRICRSDLLALPFAHGLVGTNSIGGERTDLPHRWKMLSESNNGGVIGILTLSLKLAQEEKDIVLLLSRGRTR
jgi:hypothetical protein